MSDDFAHESPEKVKEIIFYFCSRLRAATAAIVEPENLGVPWMLKFYIYELVIPYHK